MAYLIEDTEMHKAHKVDTVVIGERKYLTRHWLMNGAGRKGGDAAHREYYSQFCTAAVMAVVKRNFTADQWLRMAAAYRKGGDNYLNGCSELRQWDRLSDILRHTVGGRVTACEYAEFPKGKAMWSLSTAVSIAKEAARLLIENGEV
jgi:hypothetical protein